MQQLQFLTDPQQSCTVLPQYCIYHIFLCQSNLKQLLYRSVKQTEKKEVTAIKSFISTQKKHTIIQHLSYITFINVQIRVSKAISLYLPGQPLFSMMQEQTCSKNQTQDSKTVNTVYKMFNNALINFIIIYRAIIVKSTFIRLPQNTSRRANKIEKYYWQNIYYVLKPYSFNFICFSLCSYLQ